MSIERLIDVGDTSIEMKQLFVSDVNGVVWDSALVAIHFLTENSDIIKGKKILDLGSGTGAVSIVCGVLGGIVTATDLPDRLELIKENTRINQDNIKGSVQVEELDWSDGYKKDAAVDLLLVIDCVYYKASIESLITTMMEVKAKKTLLAYEVRDLGETIEAQEMFMKRVSEEFVMDEVAKEQLGEYGCDDIKLYFLTPK